MAEFLGQMDPQMQALHARLDALLSQQQSRFADLSWGLDGTNPLGHEQVEGFYGALDGMQDDRLEYARDYGLDQLHDRLDDMQQARQQEQSQSRDHGMGY
jgi:hypothetical protein